MESIRIVNDEGYKALRNLALTSPESFIVPDQQQLVEQMINEAGSESVWGPNLEIKTELQSLNSETQSGPRMDAVHAKTMRAALAGLRQLMQATSSSGHRSTALPWQIMFLSVGKPVIPKKANLLTSLKTTGCNTKAQMAANGTPRPASGGWGNLRSGLPSTRRTRRTNCWMS